MYEIAQRVLGAHRKGWLRGGPLFEPFARVSDDDLQRVESEVGSRLPADLRKWLLTIGYGDIGASLSFRREWFGSVERGQLIGAVLFAQDSLGNLYAFLPSDESIVYFCRSTAVHAILAPSFRDFMEELERRGFQLEDWVASVPVSPYRWSG